MNVLPRLALIFLGVGLGLGLVAFALYRLDRSWSAQARRAEGAVVAVEAVSFQKGKRALIEFSAGDRKVRFHEKVGSSVPTRRPGDRVDVLYDPSDPERNALVDDF